MIPLSLQVISGLVYGGTTWVLSASRQQCSVARGLEAEAVVLRGASLERATVLDEPNHHPPTTLAVRDGRVSIAWPGSTPDPYRPSSGLHAARVMVGGAATLESRAQVLMTEQTVGMPPVAVLRASDRVVFVWAGPALGSVRDLRDDRGGAVVSVNRLRVSFAVLVSASLVIGCGGAGDGGGEDDAGLRGPPAGRLTFDAAMLDDVDASGPARDGGALLPPRDGGPPPPRDAGRVDAGRRCTGVASSCLSVGPTACTLQRGCYRDGDCEGVSRSCYSIYNSYSCVRQDGCYWSTSRDDCSGSARYCSAYSGSSSCAGQDGCRWEDDCSGSPYSCSLLSVTECTAQRGCYLE